MDPHYDTIGKTYSLTRTEDPRITQWLIKLLALEKGSSVIDIGAGTGNYSWALAEHGFNVSAVEPSHAMRQQAKPHTRLNWVASIAESLPFANDQFDGAIMTLALHHLKDWRQSISEALRVTGIGPFIIFTFDVNHKTKFWLFDYFPKLVEIDNARSPTMEDLTQFVTESLGATLKHISFPLPKDLIDHFSSADWAHPEAYLQKEFRRGISSFAKLDRQYLDQGLQNLRNDLETGRWHQKYGDLLNLEKYDQGYLFIRLCS